MTFLRGCVDLFTGRQASHMGLYQYVDHAGAYNGKSMSGAKLWAAIEAAELHSGGINLFRCEERLLQAIASDIGHRLPEKTPVLEMGTGTLNAFCHKTLPIVRSLHSDEYICVDESSVFLQEIARHNASSSFSVRPILDDFFDGTTCYFDDDERDVLVCMFGSTIGNIVAPLSQKPPREALVEHLSRISYGINRGHLLVSFDADRNGEKIETFYTKQALFQLNTFYRMAAELPIAGAFSPAAFSYEAEWIPSSGQLAHMAIVQEDMAFRIGEAALQLHTGQRLHMKNSFKFLPDFFMDCCVEAGFEVEHCWGEPSGTNVCLLKKRVCSIARPGELSLRASA